MRYAFVLLVAFACSCAFGSDPGQPLDCNDWVFHEPGHTCEVVEGSIWSTQGTNRFVDNDGRVVSCNGGSIYGSSSSNLLQIGEIIPRTEPNGSFHSFSGTNEPCGASCSNVSLSNVCWFDAVNGYIYVPGWNTCNGYPQQEACGYTMTPRLFRIGGFTRLFDVFQTYTPPTSSLGFRVPPMPEGMAGANYFDTYWGNLTHPLDFTQAHPLQCDYPAASPHVGDYLTVLDTVPTPAPGQGVYYLTAATYQGATRYGRKTTAGHLTGRDPSLLPACSAGASR